MELYTLDNLLRRVAVVDQYESLIWTERYGTLGDFELHIQSTPETRNLFKEGTKLAVNTSYRVMEVETTEKKTDADGKAILRVTGPSLERILDDRLAKATLGDTTTDPKWIIEDVPAEIARKVFNDICVLGNLRAADIIPFIQAGTIFPEGTLPEPTEVVKMEIEPKSVYEVIEDICKIYDLGFRLVRNFDASELYFDIYAGSDRTTSQNILDPVVFAPDLDNLQNTTELTTISGSKNVAYVFNAQGFEEVYAVGTDPEVAGFERRVLLVSADDIEGTPTAEEISTYLIQKGKDELSKARSFSAFDGEISQDSNYTYGIDYELGDIVELRNVDGATNKMRVIEQIFVSDAEGERSYPTLAINLFITPGSWLAWDYNQVWEEVDPDLDWADA
jgi:hypothetical protein